MNLPCPLIPFIFSYCIEAPKYSDHYNQSTATYELDLEGDL